MPALFAAIASFFTPAVVFFASVASIVIFLLAVLANPKGWINLVICSVVDMIASFFPSTPPSLRLNNIIIQLGASIPLFGVGVIREIVGTMMGIVSIILIIKIYKLIPFKAT